MASRSATAERAIRDFLDRSSKGSVDVDLDTRLFADGLGLDSLETAELSVVLEDALGTDPFSVGDMPQSVGEIVAFYGADEPAGAEGPR